ncbi:MAG: MFS transporter [Clostridia bacterium]|nr:MFS transporter [Clostridia bacterium]
MSKNWKTTLYIVWGVQIMSLMSFSFGMPFLSFYIQDLGVVDPDQIKLITGILNASPAIGMAIMAPIWGMISDRGGKKPMLIRAIGSAAVILFGLGIVNSVGGLIAFRVLQGFLTGTITAAAALISSETPDEHMSYALGVLTSSTFIGYSLGPALGGILAEAIGYKFSFMLGGGLMLLTLFVVIFFVKETKREKKSDHEIRKIKFKYILTPVVIITLLIVFFIRLGRTFPSPYISLYIQQIRGSIEGSAMTTGLITAATSIVTALSALLLSRLGDRYDKKKLIVIYLIVGILISIPLLFTNTLVSFSIFYILIFFAIGGIEPLIMSYAVTLVPDDRRGTLFGIQGTVGSIAWAIGPMLGSFTTIRFGLESVFVFMPVFLILGLGSVLFMKQKTKKTA